MKRLGLLTLLGAASAVFFTFALWLLFRAGCAGDTKGGGYGDPLVALQLEDAALPFFVVAVAGIIILIASLRAIALRYRVALVVAFVLTGAPVLWLTGLRVESWGLRSCS